MNEASRAADMSLRTVPSRLMLFMGIPSPELAQLAIAAGIQSVVLDCEHGFPFGSEIRSMVVACRAAGGNCLVRLPAYEMARIPSVADLGATGIVLSGVRALSEIAEAYRLTRFPRAGLRSVNPFVPAVPVPGDLVALERSAEQFEVWAMAETAELLADVGRALELPSPRGESTGTGLLVGPYDLSAALSCNNDWRDARLLGAVHAFATIARRLGIQLGMFVRDPPTLGGWQSVGVAPDAVVLGYDRDIWFQECRKRAVGAGVLTAGGE